VQQKLTKLYNDTRSQLIRFLYLFGLSTVLCSTLQLLLCIGMTSTTLPCTANMHYHTSILLESHS
jgi:hypothetical protein